MNHHKSPHNFIPSPRKHSSHIYSIIHPSPYILPKLFFFFFLFVFLSCERVIEVDLNDANPQIVIEGNLSFYDAELEVKISKTGSYFSTTSTEKVENATVYLENEEGTRVDAKPVEPGLYKTVNFPVKQEKEYTLHIEYEGSKYVAKSTLHPPVKVDSLSYEYQQDVRFFEGGFRLLLYFTDPLNEENYYRVKVYKNGILLNDVDDLIVFDDSGLNGKGIQVKLRRQIFDAGDTAKVQFLSIDEPAFRYFSTFREMASTNPGSPAPANPISNFNNGALGYFSAWSESENEVVIAE